MPSEKPSMGWTAALVIFAATLLLMTAPAVAQQETVLYSFGNDTEDGRYPQAGVTFDAVGNLYGTTNEGGVGFDGTVFELLPKAGGGWTEKVLHHFHQNGSGGFSPYGGVIVDAEGNLYGTTFYGGAHGLGTVFELVPTADGRWTEKVLHNFTADGGGGDYLFGSLIMDASGNLYGTTGHGGALGGGTAFELLPNSSGSWTERVLHNFNLNGPGGAYPVCSLIFDAAGNLYGTTAIGGNFGMGTAFELLPNADASWSERVLHSFSAGEAVQPYVGLVFDALGNLYGTTQYGGPWVYGTVFQLTPNPGGGWSERVLHAFKNDSTDGHNPLASLVVDAAGNLYGTTLGGGSHNWGTVFEMTPSVSGVWTEKILHSFNNDGSDGATPYASLIFDEAGNLYGTTQIGGTYGHGTVFEISP